MAPELSAAVFQTPSGQVGPPVAIHVGGGVVHYVHTDSAPPSVLNYDAVTYHLPRAILMARAALLLATEPLDKVTGRAEYTHTMRLPGMLHGKIFRSTVAHGRIKSIDTSAAEAHPKVKAVITGATLDIALQLLALPREVGKHPDDGKVITALHVALGGAK